MSNEGDYASVRAIEMRLFEEVGNQLKAVTDALQALTHETRDMRDRLIKIEAQNQPEKLQSIDKDIRELYERLNQAERDRADREEKRAAAAAAAALKKNEEDGEFKVALEKRMTRVEMIYLPLVALASAIMTAVITHFIH